MRPSIHSIAATLALAFALVAPARSQTLVWNNVTDWAAGTTNKTETAANGNQLHFTFANSLTGDTVSHYVQNSPAVTNFAASNLVADGGTGQKVLYTAVNFDPTTGTNAMAGNVESVTITVTLSQPTTALSFNIYDIDASAATNPTYVDQVRNILASSNGTTYNIQPTISATAADNTVYIQSRDGGAYTADNSATIINAITGTASNTPQNNAGANRTILFTSATPITSFEFTYGNNTVTQLGNVAPNDPSIQIIGIGDVAVPEPGTLAVVGLGMAGAASAMFRRRR